MIGACPGHHLVLSQPEEVGKHYLSTFLFKSSTSCYPQRWAREVLVSLVAQ